MRFREFILCAMIVGLVGSPAALARKGGNKIWQTNPGQRTTNVTPIPNVNKPIGQWDDPVTPHIMGNPNIPPVAPNVVRPGSARSAAQHAVNAIGPTGQARAAAEHALNAANKAALKPGKVVKYKARKWKAH